MARKWLAQVGLPEPPTEASLSGSWRSKAIEKMPRTPASQIRTLVLANQKK